MSSDRRPSLRLRRRFGFSSPARTEKDKGSAIDDILDSMNRRTALSAGLEEEPGQAQQEELAQPYRPVYPMDRSWSRKGHSLGKAALALLAFVGVVMIWSFGSLYQTLNLQVIGPAAQDPALREVYSDPVRLAATAFLCLIPIMTLRRVRRRNNSNLIIGSTDVV